MSRDDVIALQDRLHRRALRHGRMAREGATIACVIPLWIKIVYTVFLVVLVPFYAWHYGFENFLWFSNIALLLTCVAMWMRSPLLLSMQAVSVVVLELLWIVDFSLGLLLGSAPAGLADYMFNPQLPLWLRALSLYHVPLPFLLLWLVYRLGYDPRGWLAQTALAWIVLPVCYFFTDPRRNVNWVFGPGGQPQALLPPPLYLLMVMVLFPLCVYLPSHLALRRLDKRWRRHRPP
jgi:hypothetical protein